jgi:hypothetical protein
MSKLLEISTTSFIDKQALFVEELLNNTNNITKISPNSVLFGFSAGTAKLMELLEKDISVFASRLNPHIATGQYLDECAKIKGVYQRLSATKSSTFVRINALPGTEYLKNTHTLVSSENSTTFSLNNNIIISESGYAYVGVTSVQTGSNVNVSAFSISKFNIQPSGHISVYNEVKASGGNDLETDDFFRNRILLSNNLHSVSNLELCNQIALLYNSNIYKIIKLGKTSIGQIQLGVVTKNNSLLSDEELLQLSLLISNRVSISDSFQSSYSSNIILKNVQKYPVDISFKCKISQDVKIKDIISNIQDEIMNYFSPLNFEGNKTKIEWDNLFDICKYVEGIDYIDDESFSPSSDINIGLNIYPVLRGFQILTLEGNIIFDSNFISPVYYENIQNFSFQKTVIYK